MVASNDAVFLFLLWRLPRHMDGSRVVGVDLHILGLSRHCEHINAMLDIQTGPVFIQPKMPYQHLREHYKKNLP